MQIRGAARGWALRGDKPDTAGDHWFTYRHEANHGPIRAALNGAALGPPVNVEIASRLAPRPPRAPMIPDSYRFTPGPDVGGTPGEGLSLTQTSLVLIFGGGPVTRR